MEKKPKYTSPNWTKTGENQWKGSISSHLCFVLTNMQILCQILCRGNYKCLSCRVDTGKVTHQE